MMSCSHLRPILSPTYRTKNQRKISISLCRAHAARRGLQVVQTFEDKARSGGSILGRDGLMRLMDAARTEAFDVVVVEASIVCRATWRIRRASTSGYRSSGLRSMRFMTKPPTPFLSASAA